ncbi:MAG: YraN family protein [Candidatus Omnitrophica bacterium]|nr:YraN family protein [Candidatus Omnitrophota bacterium]
MGVDRKTLGKRGEDLAAMYLVGRGYTVIARNYSCPFGELDLVCRDQDMIVFVEVKTRRTAYFAMPEESVGWDKRRRLLRCGLYYLKAHDQLDEPCRFDVVSVYAREGLADGRVRVLKDCIWEMGG